jgi:hypothetical protein
MAKLRTKDGEARNVKRNKIIYDVESPSRAARPAAQRIRAQRQRPAARLCHPNKSQEDTQNLWPVLPVINEEVSHLWPLVWQKRSQDFLSLCGTARAL